MALSQEATMSPTPWLDGIDPSKVKVKYTPPTSYWYNQSKKKAEELAQKRAADAKAKADAAAAAKAKADAAAQAQMEDAREAQRLAWNKANWAQHHPVDKAGYDTYKWEHDKFWIPGDKTAAGVPISVFGNNQLSWGDTVSHNWQAFLSGFGAQPKTQSEWLKQNKFSYTPPGGTSAGPADMAYENYLPGGNPAMDKALAKLKKAAEPPLSAMTIERANQYLNPITKKPMTPQDYLKYVYDTDNPESKLTSYTRVIDGIPIEFYTWLGLDGMLKDFMKPHGAGTNDAKLGSRAIWGDARLPFETGVIVDPGVAPEENYVPEGWGDFDFGGYGGGGGGGYYGNQYQQDPEVYFNQLVKWVI
jgi:hypothetical protein